MKARGTILGGVQLEIFIKKTVNQFAPLRTCRALGIRDPGRLAKQRVRCRKCQHKQQQWLHVFSFRKFFKLNTKRKNSRRMNWTTTPDVVANGAIEKCHLKDELARYLRSGDDRVRMQMPLLFSVYPARR